MFSLYLECRQEAKDLLIAELWEKGSGGITESDLDGGRCELRAFFDAGEPAAIAVEFSQWSPRWQMEEARDWVAVARSRLEPQCVGARFFLAPEWRDDPTPPGRFRINVNPGMAFGTGAHETTQLCLEALEREVVPGMTVLDAGTGSGILCKAAMLLAAGSVIACDTDPVAVELSGQQFAFVGSVDAVRSGSVDLIVANISPETIVQLAGELARCTRPRGKVIVSGFEAQEVPEVEAALQAHGVTIRRVDSKGLWSALVASR